jgi:DNA-binding transcriptional ArsR family regulator
LDGLQREVRHMRVRQLGPFGVRSWTFITNHAQVLLTVARNPEATVAEVARTTRITERSAYRVLADLQQAGYVRRGKVGRRNTYEINPDLPLGDPTLENELVGDLVELASKDGRKRTPERRV